MSGGLANLGQLVGGRIPFVQQLSQTDCGAACLTMVLRFFGHHARLEEVRQTCSVGRDGTSALVLLDAARLHGLQGRGVSVEMEQLNFLPSGTVLHWNFDHFVVLDRVRQKDVEIVDPAVGRRRVPLAEFRKSFTGVALLLEPHAPPVSTPKQRKSTKYLVLGYLKQSTLWPRILVVSITIQLFGLGVPLLTGQVVDSVIPRADADYLTTLVFGMVGLILFKGLASFLRSHLNLYLRTVLDGQITTRFLEHLVRLPLAFFQTRSAGDLVARLNSNTQVRELLTSATLSGLLDGTLVIGYLILLFFASPRIASMTLALGLLNVVVFGAYARKQRELTSKNLVLEAKSQSLEVELLTSVSTLKSLGKESHMVERWTDRYVDVLNASLHSGKVSATVHALIDVLHGLGPIAILVVGAHEVLSGRVSLGSMLALNSLAANFLTPLGTLVNTAISLTTVGSLLERIDEVLETEPEQDPTVVRKSHKLRGEIQLDRVSFRYGPLAPVAVSNVSLTVRRGQFVAVVGTSGAGKTTLAHLLLGMHVPTSGRILFDGVEFRDLNLQELRRQIGSVSQQQDLFGASIRENIAFGEPGLTLNDVVAAAKLAQIHDDIVAMPMGYNTVLADRGGSLSGGQRQRIILARALVRRPALLLLDEATSALDSVTELLVHQALGQLGCTRVVVAHRLSTVMKADVILVLHEGSIVEMGTHDELLELGGAYRRLVDAQVFRALPQKSMRP